MPMMLCRHGTRLPLARHTNPFMTRSFTSETLLRSRSFLHNPAIMPWTRYYSKYHRVSLPFPYLQPSDLFWCIHYLRAVVFESAQTMASPTRPFLLPWIVMISDFSSLAAALCVPLTLIFLVFESYSTRAYYVTMILLTSADRCT